MFARLTRVQVKLLMIATMEPFDDRTLEPPEDRGYGAS